MADDLLDFQPLYPLETEATILARMRESANEGLDPEVDGDRWVATEEGSHWHVCVMPSVREFARTYDFLGTEVVAAAMPVWAWGEYLDDHAEVVEIVRLAATPSSGEVTFTGAEGTVIAAGTTVGVEPATPDAEAPEFEVVAGGTIDRSGEIILAVRAVLPGIAGNVSAGAITQPSTPLPDITFTNADPTTGGTEAETDESLRERVIAAYTGQGAGNRKDYERWARAWAGVGRVTVIPLWNGAGTVKVIPMTADSQPVSTDVVTGLQADLDPTDGLGDGRAPIGAHVTVQTAVLFDVDISATIETESGYSLDGADGTVAIEADITAALRGYVESVESGGEIVYAKVLGQIADVVGVHDVGSLLVNAGRVNVTVGAGDTRTPPSAPNLGTVTLTAGSV